MSTATVWNRESTNYGKNAFVQKNGTNSFEIDSESQAIQLLLKAIHNESIERIDLELATGLISWFRKPTHGMCECDGCHMCDDCYDQFEQFKIDTENDDFDLNDPRR